MEIGLFQLENLILTRTGFGFFDIRNSQEYQNELPPDVTRLLAASERIQIPEVTKRLETWDKSAPVVLICATGKTSAELAGQLEAAGHTNVYTVNRGVSGLVEELR
jgi:filamentous hemagglutinin family protein